MKEYFYCLDGQTVDGPHSEREMKELLLSQKLAPETQVCPAGEKDWIPLGSVRFSEETVEMTTAAIPELPPVDEERPVDHQAIAEAGSDDDGEAEEEGEKDLSKYQLLKVIRADLDLLWKAQRESLISQIRAIDLDPAYETTRKQAKLIKARVNESILAYWQKDRTYDQWIRALVWKDCDIQRKLRGSNCDEKYADAKQWLTEAKLIDEAGCYCFKANKKYLYIGKAGGGESNLGRRLNEHRHKVWLEEATHLRIIIPRHRSWISKLERLLLMNYPQTRYNTATPAKGNNAADHILDLLEKEMNDLLSDG
ncbi:hypothetical protein SAMN05444156_0108 [Verrucomicrobium sp. GAS474]|uniref:GYF domain-containing protein n=1 Tax=Verrucomicrobium sp. GAS474 TaxID=1882831 RepID=UPI00087CB627|nr:GYF domain-containing protein [Verrucomicrobium sp. GAS474]SDT86044.1 hypothetical protein SAMN05444156_0108 [Verrucomicrobium sp. GAS474]